MPVRALRPVSLALATLVVALASLLAASPAAAHGSTVIDEPQTTSSTGSQLLDGRISRGMHGTLLQRQSDTPSDDAGARDEAEAPVDPASTVDSRPRRIIAVVVVSVVAGAAILRFSTSGLQRGSRDPGTRREPPPG